MPKVRVVAENGGQAGRVVGRSVRRRGPVCLLILVAALILFAPGCSTEQGDRPIGEGYAGAMSPSLRDRLGAGSTVVGTLKPGEHVVIYQRRRRWARVRTASKQEGWVDERNILAPEEYAKFQGAVKSVAVRPSQALAHSRSTLNLHLDPDRKAPAFYQLAEGEACDIIEHRAMPKPLPPGATPPPAAQPSGQPPQSGQAQQAGQAPAAAPAAKPEPPAKKAEPAAKGKKGKAGKKERRLKPAGPDMEDWFLVRGKDKAGWAVARMIDMAIPDDVAQYAEGKPIVAWQVLNEVVSDDQKKAQYIWATSDEAGLPYDFTGIRVFIWNMRHHRYETSYRERNLRGVYPLAVGKAQLKTGEVPTFTITTLDNAGNRVSRELVLLGNVVRRRDQVE